MDDERAVHAGEIASGHRFAFGKNWRGFLDHLNEERILSACKSLQELLEFESFNGVRFLDVGSGSGLFSLAAMHLGAAGVRSFDYDPGSVECAKELRRRYFPEDPRWEISEGSVLEKNFLESLGRFDVVYAWGVLHHTGNMRLALENIIPTVAPGGHLVLAIYNDQGRKSRLWRSVKKAFCRTPGPLRPFLFFPIPLFYETRWMLVDLVSGRIPFANWRKQGERGMNAYHDWIDWLGGYPFEVAKPEDIFRFFKEQGFRLEKLVTRLGGWGNNEYVFRREIR